MHHEFQGTGVTGICFESCLRLKRGRADFCRCRDDLQINKQVCIYIHIYIQYFFLHTHYIDLNCI